MTSKEAIANQNSKYKKEFEKICKDIKSLKIQGATNVAKAAVVAYSINKTKEAKRKLISLRSTEPALVNALNNLENSSEELVLSHFKKAQEKINEYVYKIIKNKRVKIVYTHCHSSTVTHALIEAKNKGKHFEVYNTETRPLYQGRLTSEELSKAKIKVTEFVDSAFLTAIKETDIILIGADAVLDSGVMNKIGSNAIAELAHLHKKPLYIITDSWKFSPKNVKIEERDFHEVWNKAPKNIKIKNLAFEKIDRKYVKAIVSELGILSYDKFLKKAKKSIEL